MHTGWEKVIQMTHHELNSKFVKAFGLTIPKNDPLILMSFTITLTGEGYPVIEARYLNTKNIIDDEMEEVLKTFELKEIE